MSPPPVRHRTSSRHSSRSGGPGRFRDSCRSCRPWARCKSPRPSRWGRRNSRTRTFRECTPGPRSPSNGTRQCSCTPQNRRRERSYRQRTCKIQQLRSQIAVSSGPPAPLRLRFKFADQNRLGRRLKGSGTLPAPTQPPPALRRHPDPSLSGVGSDEHRGASVADARDTGLAGRAENTTVPAVLGVAGSIDAGIDGKGHVRRVEGRGAVLHGRWWALTRTGNARAGTAPDPACAATVLVGPKVLAGIDAGSDLACRLTLAATLGVSGSHHASAGLLLAGGQAVGEKNDGEPASNPSIRVHTHPRAPQFRSNAGRGCGPFRGAPHAARFAPWKNSQLPRSPSGQGLDQCGLSHDASSPGHGSPCGPWGDPAHLRLVVML